MIAGSPIPISSVRPVTTTVTTFPVTRSRMSSSTLMEGSPCRSPRPKYSSRTSTTDRWEDPLGALDLHPGRGCVEEDWRECVQEDRSEAFDDVGFHAWCVDQA